MQIDENVINLMTDDDLAKYIPAFGDRLALRHFCTAQVAKTSKAHAQPKKRALFEKLRRKMKLAKSNQQSENDSGDDLNDDNDFSPEKKRLKGNKNASK